MILKRSALLLLTCGALVAAGCGDDDDGGNADDTPPPAATTPAEQTTTEEATTTEAATTPAVDTDNPQVKAAVEACQQQIDTNAQLSEGAKKELANVCQDAASGDQQAVKEASKKVCLKVLEETGVTGAAAEQAKASCEAIAK